MHRRYCDGAAVGAGSCSRRRAEEINLTPKAPDREPGPWTAGEPVIMLEEPLRHRPRVGNGQGMKIERDIDLFERSTKAFAANPMAWAKTQVPIGQTEVKPHCAGHSVWRIRGRGLMTTSGCHKPAARNYGLQGHHCAKAAGILPTSRDHRGAYSSQP